MLQLNIYEGKLSKGGKNNPDIAIVISNLGYLCKKLGLFKNTLSHSRIIRRLHKIPTTCWQAIFRFLALIFKQTTDKREFAVDSFPVACCQKNRIDKRKIFLQRQYLGYAP